MIDPRKSVEVGSPAPIRWVSATSQSYLMTRMNMEMLVMSQSREYSSLSRFFRTMSMVMMKTKRLTMIANICCFNGMIYLRYSCRFRKRVTKMDRHILNM